MRDSARRDADLWRAGGGALTHRRGRWARRAARTACRSSSPATASSPPTASAASRTRGAAISSRRSAGCSSTSAASSSLRLDRGERPLLDAFCDALWLEDGLSRNTIASYRADLDQLALCGRICWRWARRICSPSSPRERDAPRAPRACVSSLKRFYQYCLRERRIDADPTLKLDPPKRAPRFPQHAVGSRRRGVARRAGSRHAAGPARPRDAGDALRDRPARVGAGRAEDLRGQPRHGRGARHGQGLEGAPRAARRGGGRLDRALPARNARERPTRSSSRRAAPA